MQLQELFSQEEMALLQARAERVATPLQPKDKEGDINVLLVIMQGETYGLLLEAITAVYQDVTIIPIPCAPNFVAGIANVRGHLVSILDLAMLLGLEGSSNTSGAGLIVAEFEDAHIGFRVEVIGEVVELSTAGMNPVPANMNLAHPQYLRGIFPDGTALLDMKSVLNDPRLAVDEPTLSRSGVF